MNVGHVDSSDHHSIIGWAANADSPGTRLEVRIMVNGAEHGRVVANAPRDALRQRGLYGDGAHAFTYVFDPPLSPLHAYDIVVRFTDPPADVPNGRFRLDPVDKRDLTLRPLLVTATGRSGTTLLMRRLGNSREIVIADRYPFETKLLTYYAHALEVMTTASSPRTSVALDDIIKDKYRLSLNPFHESWMEDVYPNPAMLHQFFGRRAMARLHPAFRAIIDDFYRDMQMYSQKPRARFFAEKCDVFTSARNFARLAFDDVREILLVRDLRDVHCSRRAFWSDSPERSLQNLRSVQAEMMPIYHADKQNLLVVRYEDMVQQPTETLARLSAHLGLRQAISLDADSESQIFSSHGTSADPGASIGRWKQQMSAEERASFAEIFQPYLTAFGYDADQDG